MIETWPCVLFAIAALALGLLIGMWVCWPENGRAFDRGYEKGKEWAKEHIKPIEKPNWPGIACRDCDAYKLWIHEQAREIEQTVTLKINPMDKEQLERLSKQIDKAIEKAIRGFGTI